MLRSLLFAIVLGTLGSRPLMATSNTFYLGAGENTWREAPTGANNWNNLGTYWMQNDSMPYDYVAHWFDRNSDNKFPAGCSSSGAASPLSSFQAVISANKKLFIFWWWVQDQVCTGSYISQSESRISSCLIPTLNALSGAGEVYVFLEPEYNQNVACNPAGDPAWDTHFKNMITALHGATGATGQLKVYAGPSPGGFGWDQNAYQLENSIGPQTLAVADFIGFHSIRTRDDSYKSGEPNYPSWWTPSDEGLYFSRSIARYLHKRFNKPLMFGYWSHANTPNNGGTNSDASIWNTTEQDNSMTKILQNRAFFQAADDRSFGPYWYMDYNYTGEGVKSSSNVAYPVFTTWKNYNTHVSLNQDTGLHSLAFETPDQGDEAAGGALNISWISRGRTATASTYTLAYQTSAGGAYTTIASGIAGSDLTSTAYSWTPCGLSPTAQLRLRVLADDGVSVTSGTLAWKPAGWTTNANYSFESGITDWVVDPWAAGNNPTLSWSAANEEAFQGSRSLKVVGNFGTNQWANIAAIPASPIPYVGTSVNVTAHIFIPFNLNPTMGFGKVVSKVTLQMRDSAFTTSPVSPDIDLEQGWNKVTYTFTGMASSGGVERLLIHVFNKWAANGNPAFYVDEVKIGSLAYTAGPACGTPTPTFTATPTASMTATPNGTLTDTPTLAPGTPTDTPSPTPSSTPVPACTPDYNFDGGSAQAWAVSGDFTSEAVSGAQVYAGVGSLAMNGTVTTAGGFAAVNGFTLNLTNRVLTAHLWVPAAFPASNYAQLYVKDSGFVYQSGPNSTLVPGGWNTLSFDLTGKAYASSIKEIGLKVATNAGTGAGPLYLDSYDLGGGCPTATVTPAGSSPSSTATPSGSATPTRSPTATASATRTASPTASSSMTAGATFSDTPTRSATPSSSPTATASASATRSGTPSFTPSSTPSATPSLTRTITQTYSATFSVTVFAGSPTDTGTASVTASVTPSSSPSATPSATPSVTPSGTPSGSPTLTGSATASASPSITATETLYAGTPTDTATLSPSATQTLVVSDTLTSTATATVSESPTPPDTSTPTETAVLPSATPTFSATATRTPVPNTATFTRTSTPTVTFSSTVESTSTPVVASPPGSVLRALPSLNPQPGGSFLLSLLCSGEVESVDVKLYSAGYSAVVALHSEGPWNAGWHSVALPLPSLPNGTYFFLVTGRAATGAPTGLARRGKLTILR